jgi:ABC-2 type transport system ATP-binding protein
VLGAVGTEAPRTDADSQRVAVPVDGGAEQLAAVVRLLDDRRIPIDDIGLRRATLDEVFLAVTGRAPADPDRADPPADALDLADPDRADPDRADPVRADRHRAEPRDTAAA